MQVHLWRGKCEGHPSKALTTDRTRQTHKTNDTSKTNRIDETRKRKILTTLGLWMLTEETRCQVGWPSGALSLTRRRPTRRHAEEKPGPRRHLVIAIMAAGALPLLAIARCRGGPRALQRQPALESQESAV